MSTEQPTHASFPPPAVEETQRAVAEIIREWLYDLRVRGLQSDPDNPLWQRTDLFEPAP